MSRVCVQSVLLKLFSHYGRKTKRDVMWLSIERKISDKALARAAVILAKDALILRLKNLLFLQTCQKF